MAIVLALVVIAAALGIGYAMGHAAGRARARGAAMPPDPTAEPLHDPAPLAAPPRSVATAPDTREPAPSADAAGPRSLPAVDSSMAEHARILRSYESEAHALRRALASRDAAIAQLSELGEERRCLFGDLAASRGETARYRQLVVDLENNAPPPLFGIGAPDDLKLIVGVGPVLERMLHQLGVATYRQIAHWSERDIDEFDAKLHEFPGRIRRDAWVTQARSLHQSKYGEALPVRERR